MGWLQSSPSKPCAQMHLPVELLQVPCPSQTLPPAVGQGWTGGGGGGALQQPSLAHVSHPAVHSHVFLSVLQVPWPLHSTGGLPPVGHTGGGGGTLCEQSSPSYPGSQWQTPVSEDSSLPG